MRVLMFGWEFPPFNSGGLGTACFGITKALAEQGVKINFVLPRRLKGQEVDFVNLISAGSNSSLPSVLAINSPLRAYMNSEDYFLMLRRPDYQKMLYRNDLISEVARYAQVVRSIARKTPHDLIHCHDWMTLPAAIAAKKVSHQPVIAHIHSTEPERCGGRGVNPRIFHIEQEGLKRVDKVITVSHFTERRIYDNYHIAQNNIEVVYNGVNAEEFGKFSKLKMLEGKKVVLFLGRLTLHKGPDTFLKTAKKVSARRNDVIFVVSGTGDMYHRLIREACLMGVADKVLFTGFVRGKELKRIYKMADLYVMPSVAEPFGITTLEALSSKTPVLISKQSGVSEVITNCLKADFWDVDEMANKIIAILDNEKMRQEMAEKSYYEAKKMTWNAAADKILKLYNRCLTGPLP